MKKTMLFPMVIHWKRPVGRTLDRNNMPVLLIVFLTGICNIAIAQKDPIHQSFTEGSDLKGHGLMKENKIH